MTKYWCSIAHVNILRGLGLWKTFFAIKWLVIARFQKFQCVLKAGKLGNIFSNFGPCIRPRRPTGGLQMSVLKVGLGLWGHHFSIKIYSQIHILKKVQWYLEYVGSYLHLKFEPFSLASPWEGSMQVAAFFSRSINHIY